MSKKIDLEKEQERLKELKEKAEKKSKSFLTEFKQFATKGNVIDMAIGVIIGTAFTKIVNSLVNDVITPSLSILTGKIDFSSLFVALDGVKYETVEAAKEAGATIINYGQFLTNIVDFLMVALCLFIFFKVFFKARRKETPKPVTTKKCPYCLSEIPLEASRCAHCTSELKE
ncbi:MAG: large conductance mechanosensitive channel protein MscL [Clostridia bacterium]|nr:large conductance mechanosensitive channel protein MscL [Clostridia bacterium]